VEQSVNRGHNQLGREQDPQRFHVRRVQIHVARSAHHEHRSDDRHGPSDLIYNRRDDNNHCGGCHDHGVDQNEPGLHGVVVMEQQLQKQPKQ
jgi:hypothetical protein